MNTKLDLEFENHIINANTKLTTTIRFAGINDKQFAWLAENCENKKMKLKRRRKKKKWSFSLSYLFALFYFSRGDGIRPLEHEDYWPRG